MKYFAMIGAGGYVAPRHMKAIKETGNELVAALDINDSARVLDSYFPHADFFTDLKNFERHLEKQKSLGKRTGFVTVCSPNHLHDDHVRFGLRMGADVICEKPVVLDPWGVDALVQAEKETGRKVFTILQLRLHPAAKALKEKIDAAPPGKKYQVNLQYITARGNWYHTSWKGDIQKSGGIATNIGVHFFDLLLWIFGDVKKNNVRLHTSTEAAGQLELEKADVNWMLSIEEEALPAAAKAAGKQTYRVLTIDDDVFDFSEGFADLHTQSYAAILAGNGFPLIETRKVIALVEEIRNIK